MMIKIFKFSIKINLLEVQADNNKELKIIRLIIQKVKCRHIDLKNKKIY